MESRRYWQESGKMIDKAVMSRQEGGSQESCNDVDSSRRKIVYGGQLISVDVYLTVPTFIRRGITIAV